MLAAPAPPTTQFAPGSVLPRTDERRSCNRIQRRSGATMTSLGCVDGVACTVENVSEGGAYLFAPRDCGLRLGDRCELILLNDFGGGSFHCEQGTYATIIRTETAMRDYVGVIGIGLRFDQPLYF